MNRIAPSLLLLAWLAAGPSPAPAATSAGKPRVVTSLLPLYCLTKQIAGDGIAVDNLLVPGTDAHDFQFTRRERDLLDRAQLVVVNGLGMEPWLRGALRRSSPGVKVLEAAAGLDPVAATGLPPNPHVWLDPLLACRMVTNILTALQALEPRGSDFFAANASGLVARLEALHRELQATLEPCRGAGMVTHHDAFAHFARRYDLRVVGVIEEVPDIDPSPRHLSKLRQIIASEHVRALFVEPQHPNRLARQLGRDLGLAVAPLDTLESGPARPEAYEEGMRSNARVLREYLPKTSP